MRRIITVSISLLLLWTVFLPAQAGTQEQEPLPEPLAVEPDDLRAPTETTAVSYEHQVLEIVNQERWNNGQLPPLKGNASLESAAELHSQRMAEHDFFDHCDLDNKTTPAQRVLAEGYNYNSTGENIAAGYGDPSSVMSGWMNSAGHRGNILHTGYRELGVGYFNQADDQGNVRYDDDNDCAADSSDNGPFGNYWTQNFGRINDVMPVVINREAYETNTREVDLYMYGAGWATEMRFQNEDSGWSAWQPYAADVAWTLSEGDGEKTVHAEIRDGGGAVRSASDTIMLTGSGGTAVLSLSTASLSYTAVSGAVSSQNKTFTINNTGDAAMTWTISENPEAAWISLSPAAGETGGGDGSDVTVTVDPTGLAVGSYQTTLDVDAGSVGSGSVTVTLTINEQGGNMDNFVYLPAVIKGSEGTAVLSVAPASLLYTVESGDTTSQNKTLTVSNTGDAAMTWTVSENPDAAWVSLSTAGGETAGGGGAGVTVTVDPSGLTAGTYQINLIVDAGSAGSDNVSVTLTIDDSSETWLDYVNMYRDIAGSPPVTEDATLNDNCRQHARYMAENNDLTHNQDPNLPYASDAGQICAGNGNVWMGSAFSTPIWEPIDSVEGWMSSVGHRLWLLYPTTPTFGYGFYTAENNRAAAALDVISHLNYAADASYGGWPVQYPAPGQTAVPASRYPITINWAYFGLTPILSSTSLIAEGGAAIPHTADTALPVGHEGVQIYPDGDLPDDTIFTVTIEGSYDGTPFSYTWQFSTGDAPIP